MTKAYSSVNEALQSGILNNDNPRRPSRRARRGSRSGTSSLTQSFTAGPSRRGSIHTVDTRSSMSNMSSIGENIIVIKGLRLSSSPPPQREIDASEMTPEDLGRLKSEDPFMYYSIPKEERDRACRPEDGAPPPLVVQNVAVEGGRRRESCMAAPSAAAAAGDLLDAAAEAAAAAAASSAPCPRPSLAGHRSISCPAGMLANAELTPLVTRRRRLSVEVHVLAEEDSSDEEGTDEEDLASMLDGLSLRSGGKEDEKVGCLRELLNAGMDSDDQEDKECAHILNEEDLESKEEGVGEGDLFSKSNGFKSGYDDEEDEKVGTLRQLDDKEDLKSEDEA